MEWKKQKIIHHKPVSYVQRRKVKKIYDDPIYETVCICDECGFKTTDKDEFKLHLLESCEGKWHAETYKVDTEYHVRNILLSKIIKRIIKINFNNKFIVNYPIWLIEH